MEWSEIPSSNRPPYYDWYLGVKNMTLDSVMNDLNIDISNYRKNNNLGTSGGSRGTLIDDGRHEGHYEIDAFIMDGERLDRDMLVLIDMDYSLTLNEDFSAEIKTDSLISGTWTYGYVYFSEDGVSYENPYTLENGILTLELAIGATLIFKKVQ
jgi:hypothetical protein